MSFVAIGLALFGYLLGSIPCGLLLARLTGAPDPRKVGSGNIGATNVLRSGGKALGTATLIFDILKGLIPTLVASLVLDNLYFIALVGFCAFLGHLFPIYLKFKGGKGVATAIGVMLILTPKALLISLLCFLIVVWIWRMVSLGSLLASILLPLWGGLWGYPQPCVILSGIIALFIIIRHGANIKRILAGTESRMGKEKEAKG